MRLPLYFSRNKVLAQIAAADPALPNRAGLRYLLTLYVQEHFRSNTFIQLPTLTGAESPVQTINGAQVYPGATFELHDLLDAYLATTPPRYAQSSISVCQYMTRQFYMEYAVQDYDEELSGDTSPTGWVLKAGLPERYWYEWDGQALTDPTALAGKFLTWQPDNKYILPDQPEFLYWLNNLADTPTWIRLACAIWYRDGSTSAEYGSIFSSLSPMTVYCVPVGLSALNLPDPDEITQYAVWLEDQDGAMISEQRTYFVDHRHHAQYRFVLFANSLGGYDTIALVGDASEKIVYTRVLSERAPDPLGLPTYAERVISQNSGSRELTVNTGFITQEVRTWLQELYLSKEVYIATDREFLPLLPGNTDFVSEDTTETLTGQTLTFTYANREQNAAVPMPKAPPRQQRPTTWQPFATACELNARGIRTGKLTAVTLRLVYSDTGEAVVPAQIRANLPGEDGYLPPQNSATCQTTPFLSAAISRPGSFTRNNCAAGEEGTAPLITVAAGLFGSERSQADADARAEAYFTQLNTQETANSLGTCVLSSELYNWNVPAGHWHYRGNRPSLLEISFVLSNDPSGSPVLGNAWSLQGTGGAYVFPVWSNDLDLPVRADGYWLLRVFGPAGSSRRIRQYRNGVLLADETKVMNSEGFELVAVSMPMASGDKFYFSITNE